MADRDIYSILVSLKSKAPFQFNELREYLHERKISTACDGMAPNSDQFTHMVQGAYRELDSLITLFDNCEEFKRYKEAEQNVDTPFII